MHYLKQILDYIFIIGAAQGILLAVFLLKKQENKTANRILGWTIIAFVIELFMAVYINSGMYLVFAHFIGITAGFPYLYGPGIYLYVIMLGHRREGFKRKYWLHYIPFILVFIATIVIFIPADAAFKIALFNPGFTPPLYITVVGNLIPLHGCTYAVLTILKSRQFNRALKDSYSNIDKINLGWLTFLSSSGAIVWAVVVVAYVLEGVSDSGIPGYMLIYSAISILVYTMGYKSLRQPAIQIEEPGQNTGEPGTETGRDIQYKKSGLQEEAAKAYLEQLLQQMADKKPYLNNELCLSDLASMLNISTHNLSEVINSRLNENFYDFVNKYRVEEVKRLITTGEGQKYNLLSLGYEAGFSSKSAYYSAFKKVTGLTPARYKEAVLSEA